MAAPTPQRRFILAAPVDAIDLAGALRLTGGWLAANDGRLRHVVTVNPEFVIAARRDPAFAAALLAADLATADGVGIIVAGRLLGAPVGPRVTGVDFVEGVAGLRHPRARLFLLGAAPGVADAAAARLRARHPDLKIVGTHPGAPDARGWPEIARRLADARPTVLLVAFGHPRQDLWIAARRDELAALGVVVAAGVGGAFDYLSGRVPRAPCVVRRLGCEWLYRLAREPWRWRRQLALPHFAALVVARALRRRA